LKLKCYFLEERLAQLSPGQMDEALREVTIANYLRDSFKDTYWCQLHATLEHRSQSENANTCARTQKV
jgi:hypothetical protein